MDFTIVIKDGRTQLFQWDTGRKLQITGDIQPTDWVHIRLEDNRELYSVHPYKSGDVMLADIPDELLQAGKRLVVYVYVADADGNKTTIRKGITVQPRTKPEDYVYTPTEIRHWTDLEARIQKLEEGGATPEQIAAAVEAYLENNPPVTVDATLAQAGQAADAAAVGERLSSLSKEKMPNEAMTSITLGGAMADPAEEGDTQPVRIGPDNKLYTARGGGEKEYDYEKIIVLDEAVASYVVDTFDDGSPLELSSLEIVSVTTNKTASTVNIRIDTDLPYTSNAGCLAVSTAGGYTGAEKWMYCWIEAKIKNGECSADFASTVSVARYLNFYSGISSSYSKLIPGITYSNTTTDIFPEKATKFTSVEVYVPAGSMESGSAIRIRGIKA